MNTSSRVRDHFSEEYLNTDFVCDIFSHKTALKDAVFFCSAEDCSLNDRVSLFCQHNKMTG